MRITKDELPAFAEKLLSCIKHNSNKNGATVLALSGDLGAGKTSLVQALAKALGVGVVPPSPTFVIMRSYETKDPIFTTLTHIDAYRFESIEELRPLHLDHVFSKQNGLVCVEWPEKLGDAIPKEAFRMGLIPIGENEREVTLPCDTEMALQN